MNIVENINNLGFELAKLVRQEERNAEPRPPRKGSAKEKKPLDFNGMKFSDMFHSTLDDFDLTIETFVFYGEFSFGITKDDFKKVKDIVRLFNKIKKFQQKSSIDFLEKNIVKWAVKLNREGKYENSLFDYVEKKLELAIKNYRFTFPMYNIDIEKPFKVGNVEITYFTQTELDEYFKELNNKREQFTKEEFEGIFRDFEPGQVVAKILTNAEIRRAEDIAKYEAGLAVDVLKCFGETMIIPTKEVKFDIDFKLNYHFRRGCLIEVPDVGIEELRASWSGNVKRFTFEEKMHFVKDYTLKNISFFLINRTNNELCNLITQSIGFLGNALSTKDMHLRIIQLFTILESLILDNDNNKDMGAKTKKRIAKLFTDDNVERQNIKDLIDDFYYIRNKMVHKAIRLPINVQKLARFQFLVFETLLKYIDYTKEYTSKEQIINEINAKMF